MRVVAIVTSRMGSSRLPGKNALPILGRPMLSKLLERLKRSHGVDIVCVATTVERSDDVLVDIAESEEVEVYRGSVNDLLGRVLAAAKSVEADVVTEITGDCPLVDPGIVDGVVHRYLRGGYEYVTNVLDCLTFPVGFDVQVYAVALLTEVAELTQDPLDRVGVTPFIYHNPERYRLLNLQAPPELHRPNYWLAVDYRQDFEVVSAVYEALYPSDPNFNATKVIRFLDSRPDVVSISRGLHSFSAYPSSGGKADQEVLSLS